MLGELSVDWAPQVSSDPAEVSLRVHTAPGSSGGPVFDTNGKVVAIQSRKTLQKSYCEKLHDRDFASKVNTSLEEFKRDYDDYIKVSIIPGDDITETTTTTLTFKKFEQNPWRRYTRDYNDSVDFWKVAFIIV